VTSVSQERWLRVSKRSLRNTAPQNGFVIDRGPEYTGRALDEGGAKAPLDGLHPAPSVPTGTYLAIADAFGDSRTVRHLQ
jgi:hypothetical protein